MFKKLRSCFLKRKQLSFSLLLVFFNLISFAQQKITVSGTVISDSNIPLASVSVNVKGRSVGTTTDAAGKFTIQANKGATLVFSYVGYEEKQVGVNNETNLGTISLLSATSALGEVVIVGYGTQKKATLTGAVSSV